MRIRDCVLAGQVLLLTSMAWAGQLAPSNPEDWFTAAASGNVQRLHEMWDDGFSVNTQNENGETALMLAVLSDQLPAVQYLARAPGADLDLRTHDEGLTALSMASHLGFVEQVKVMVAARADLERTERRGQTALIIGSKAKCLECVKSLIMGGADLEAKDIYGRTALEWAQTSSIPDVAAVLRQGVSFFEIRSSRWIVWDSEEPPDELRRQAYKGNLRNIKLILASGVSMNLEDDRGLSALDYAVIGEATSTRRYLTGLGAIYHPYAKARGMLGAEWKIKPRDRYLRFLDTIKDKELKMFELFLEAKIEIGKAQVEEIDVNAPSALIVAIQEVNLWAIQKLLDAGVEPEWQEALCLANLSGNEQMKSLFKKYWPGFGPFKALGCQTQGLEELLPNDQIIKEKMGKPVIGPKGPPEPGPYHGSVSPTQQEAPVEKLVAVQKLVRRSQPPDRPPREGGKDRCLTKAVVAYSND